MSEQPPQEPSDKENEKQQELPEIQIPKEIQELENILEDLPKEKRKEVVSALMLQFERTSWKGPLPPPDKLKEYNDAVSDGAERILRMTEKQAEHRMAMEKLVIPEE